MSECDPVSDIRDAPGPSDAFTGRTRMFFWEERELGACPAVGGRLEVLSGQGRRSLGGQVEAAGTGRQKAVQIFSLDLQDQVVFLYLG